FLRQDGAVFGGERIRGIRHALDGGLHLLGALLRRQRGPGRIGGLRGGDGIAHILRRGGGGVAHDAAWLGRIGDRHLLLGLAHLAADVQGGADGLGHLRGWSGHVLPLFMNSFACGAKGPIGYLRWRRIGTPLKCTRDAPRAQPSRRPGIVISTDASNKKGRRVATAPFHSLREVAYLMPCARQLCSPAYCFCTSCTYGALATFARIWNCLCGRSTVGFSEPPFSSPHTKITS